MISVGAGDGKARLTRMWRIERDGEPECRGTGIRSANRHRRRLRGVCVGRRGEVVAAVAAVEQVAGAPTAANDSSTSK